MTNAEITLARATAQANLAAAQETLIAAQANLEAAQTAHNEAQALQPEEHRYSLTLDSSLVDAGGLTTQPLIINEQNVSANASIAGLINTDAEWQNGRFEISTAVDADHIPLAVVVKVGIEDPGASYTWEVIQ